MLAFARDEAHRASNAFRVKLGLKRRFRSELDDIKGVGPKTRAKLLRALGSASAVREASEEELVAAGATRKQAQAIRRAFHGPDGSGPATADSATAEAHAVDNAFAEVEDEDAPSPPQYLGNMASAGAESPTASEAADHQGEKLT